MSLEILQGNLIEASTDAILLTIDGTNKGNYGGSVTRGFARKWPEVWEEIEDDLPFPLPLGRIFTMEPSTDCDFDLVIVASTLHHQDTLSESAKKGVVRTAMHEAIRTTSSHKLNSIATSVMTGGWRLSQEEAFLAMSEGYESAIQTGIHIKLGIYVLDEAQFQRITSFARGLGFR